MAAAASKPARRPINTAWHAANPMPARATLEQRVAWHLAHAKGCGCREIPAGIRGALRRRSR